MNRNLKFIIELYYKYHIAIMSKSKNAKNVKKKSKKKQKNKKRKNKKLCNFK